MLKLKVTILLVSSFLFIQCSNSPTGPNVRDLNQLEKQLVTADNQFGFNLFKTINTADKGKSLFISPLSVSMALGMTRNGAAGETERAMQSVLAFDNMSDDEVNQSYRSLIDLLVNLDPKVTMQLANSIWTRQGMTFNEDFLNTNKTYFDAFVQALDFNDANSVAIINNWVKDNTNGKIEKIVDRIDAEAVMFLINAIYFKGTWAFEFDKDLTGDAPFHLADGTETTVRMMHLTGDLNYFENDLFQAVDLSYGAQLYSMMILLPKPDTDIDDLVNLLNAENWQFWNNNLHTTAINLSLPKFKLDYEISLKDVLSAMGMGIAFDPDRADFGRMLSVPEQVLFLTNVKHKTFVEVNEEGTAAAAVTSVEVGVTSVPERLSVNVNHPFLFVIRDHNSGAIIFMGKMLEPVQ